MVYVWQAVKIARSSATQKTAIYIHIALNSCILQQNASFICGNTTHFRPEDVGSMFLRNGGIQPKYIQQGATVHNMKT